jgi:PAS domain S-box-containing protein
MGTDEESPDFSASAENRPATVTELKKENERLRRELDTHRRRFDLLLEHIPEGILFVEGPEVRITAVSKRGQEMLGYPLPSLLQRSIIEYLDRLPDRVLFPENLALLRAIQEGSTTINEEIVYRHPDGQEMVILSSSGPILDEDGNITGAVIVWTDITERKFTEEALRKARRDFRNLASHLDRLREEQNKRVAQEIHDELGQALTAAKIELSMLELALPADNLFLRQRIQTVSLIINDVMAGMRKISGGLRPSVLDHLGLEAAIDWLTLDFQERTGISCVFESVETEATPDDPVAIAIYRILEEALTNIEQHSQARNVRVQLDVLDESVHLEVTDDGVGFDPSRVRSETLGILGMKERARRLGGQLTIESSPGTGTRLTATLPLQAQD